MIVCLVDATRVAPPRGRNLEQGLVLIGELTPALLHRDVERILLVGSHKACCHQELCVRCENRRTLRLRIPHVDGADTPQVAEREEEFDDLPTLLVMDTFRKPITSNDIHSALELSRNLMKRYDQGDSHSLSLEICEELAQETLDAEVELD